MSGIIGTYPTIDTEVVWQGIRKLKHRGPDAESLVKTPKGALGHTRLAIIDVENGDQPMRQGDCWIVFNGEIYNYQKLSKLISTPLETASDTEVVLQLYRQFGTDCVSMLDGMFAFAITGNSSIFLARDPIGIKPLYYATSGEKLYFASEIKALQGISSQVMEFPPGYWWHSDLGMKQYYKLDKNTLQEQKPAPPPNDKALNSIRDRLRQAVEKQMMTDASVPLGISLSGGLDSSVVAAFARQMKDDLKTFVVGISGSSDLAASVDVAKYLGTVHHRYQYTYEEMLEALPEVIYFLESFDAALVRSAIPNFFLAKLASDHVKVILTGEGADELYAGYDYFANFHEPDTLQREMVEITKKMHNTGLQRSDRMSMAYGIETRVPFLDTQFIDYSFSLPAYWKLHKQAGTEKALLRNACRELVPKSIIKRPKQKFSDGAGSMNMLAAYANERITDEEFLKNRVVGDGIELRSKEEMYYYHIYNSIYGDTMDIAMVGRTRSVTDKEFS